MLTSTMTHLWLAEGCTDGQLGNQDGRADNG
jgi:hypothetical protein